MIIIQRVGVYMKRVSKFGSRQEAGGVLLVRRSQAVRGIFFSGRGVGSALKENRRQRWTEASYIRQRFSGIVYVKAFRVRAVSFRFVGRFCFFSFVSFVEFVGQFRFRVVARGFSGRVSQFSLEVGVGFIGRSFSNSFGQLGSSIFNVEGFVFTGFGGVIIRQLCE